jgi:hypothetical protein
MRNAGIGQGLAKAAMLVLACMSSIVARFVPRGCPLGVVPVGKTGLMQQCGTAPVVHVTEAACGTIVQSHIFVVDRQHV